MNRTNRLRISQRSGVGGIIKNKTNQRGRASIAVALVAALFSLSFAFTILIFVRVGILSSSEVTPLQPSAQVVPGAPGAPWKGALAKGANDVIIADDDDDDDALMSDQFRDWAATILADLHLIAIDTSGMKRDENENRKGAAYRGVRASFCKLNWDLYKMDPPALPMFKFLVSKSGCDDVKNVMTVDLAAAVRKTKEFDDAIRARHQSRNHNAGGIHVISPSGFVFHESRVGSTLVANALTAMDPERHRVYSESNPINVALKACEGRPASACDAASNAELLRDVVHLMGRTSSPRERFLFFKVASNGSLRIGMMRQAFPSVPWIFVYRDPVQTMMSHLAPTKELAWDDRGEVPPALCLRYKSNPPDDLVQLVNGHDENVDELSDEEFCAAQLATLCESALCAMTNPDSHGIAVEYDNLIEKLIRNVIPNHFGIRVDETARQHILNIAKIYSKSRTGDRDWAEDGGSKDARSTPEIRAASTKFLSRSYSKLKECSMAM